MRCGSRGPGVGPVAHDHPHQARSGAGRRPPRALVGHRLAPRPGRPGARRGQRARLQRGPRPVHGRDRAARRRRGHLMGPLDGVRVVEISHERGAWAGKLLGDLGAEVVVVEPPGGSVQRTYGPFLDDEPGPERSFWWWYYNTSKRGVVADLGADRDRLLALIAQADVLVEAEAPGVLDGAGLGWAAVSAA